jgi:hypothetical protein
MRLSRTSNRDLIVSGRSRGIAPRIMRETHLMIKTRHLIRRQSIVIPIIILRPTVKARRLFTLPPLLTPQRG